MKNEPVATGAGAVVLLITTGIALLKTFGVDITEVQAAAVVAFYLAVVGVAAWVRSRVDSPDTVKAKVVEALKTNPPATAAATERAVIDVDRIVAARRDA